MSRIRRPYDRAGNPIPDPWEALGVDPDSPPDVVRSAYRRLVLAHPPERDPEVFQRVNAAYRRLTDAAFVVERHLGVLEIGSPEDYGLPGPERGSGEEAPARPVRELVTGELLLYAVAEALRPEARRG